MRIELCVLSRFYVRHVCFLFSYSADVRIELCVLSRFYVRHLCFLFSYSADVGKCCVPNWSPLSVLPRASPLFTLGTSTWYISAGFPQAVTAWKGHVTVCTPNSSFFQTHPCQNAHQHLVQFSGTRF